MPSNHLILCRLLLLLPSIFPSIRVFSNEWVRCIRWPKYWSFSFSISPSNEYSGLISFRMDWLDLLAVQGTLKSLFQHHSSKASILRHSAFFIVQLSHPYMTPGKPIALTRWIFVGKVMPLLFNMLSRLVIAFLPRNKCLLISWLQSPHFLLPFIISIFYIHVLLTSFSLTGGSVVKNPPAHAEDMGTIPGSGGSLKVGNGKLFLYSCLEISIERGAWWSIGHGVAKSWTQLSTCARNLTLEYLPLVFGILLAHLTKCNKP